MPMARRFFTLDVFTETALRGNPLAVVLDCDGLDDARMQAIAREFKPDRRRDLANAKPWSGLSISGVRETVFCGLRLAGDIGRGTRENGRNLVRSERFDKPVGFHFDDRGNRMSPSRTDVQLAPDLLDVSPSRIDPHRPGDVLERHFAEIERALGSPVLSSSATPRMPRGRSRPRVNVRVAGGRTILVETFKAHPARAAAPNQIRIGTSWSRSPSSKSRNTRWCISPNLHHPSVFAPRTVGVDVERASHTASVDVSVGRSPCNRRALRNVSDAPQSGQWRNRKEAPGPTVPERSFERVSLTRRATLVPSNRTSRIDVKHPLRIAALDASIGRRAPVQGQSRKGPESRQTRHTIASAK